MNKQRDGNGPKLSLIGVMNDSISAIDKAANLANNWATFKNNSKQKDCSKS